MKIAIIGHLKFPIAKPYKGGLEMLTHAFVGRLIDRGHDVTLFASGDSDPALSLDAVVPKSTMQDSLERVGFHDHSLIEAQEDEAYERLMVRLMNSDFDVVHNHSISPIPLQFASLLPTGLITTLHVPVLPRMRDVLDIRGPQNCGTFVNISRSNARRWKGVLPHQTVIHNGIDTQFWTTYSGHRKDRVVWFGRILSDKGTHYAIDAAHAAGLAIDVVGPISNQAYFDQEVRPRLLAGDIYHGLQTHEEICQTVGAASVAAVTPCWDEPFGLVVAEALACGTPVAAFNRGAIRELVPKQVGRVVQPDCVGSLATAILECRSLSSDACRKHAQRYFSLNRMMDDYVDLYERSRLKAVV